MQVLIADKFETEGVEGLRQLGCKITQDADLSGDSLKAALASNGAEVLIVRSTQVTAAMFEAAKALKLVIRAGSGYNTIDVQAAKARGVRVANCPGTNAAAVAELTMGLIIALDRRIPDNVAGLRRGAWNKKEFGKARGLKGRTLGLVGLGKIGCLVAARAKAFDMKLLYADVVRNETAECEWGIQRVELPELLRQADFVSLHVPADPSTKHLMNAERLAMMKPTAFLINCARGDIVDTAALLKALDEGKLAGAGVDVYENEPGASDVKFADPLGAHPKVYGTHHIGASTEQAQLAVAEEVVKIVAHFQKTGQVMHCVNP
jgi:D-3-phosphoglycerate dehydrogenase